MPFPQKAQGWIAAAAKRAEAGYAHFPACRICHRPMLCGQEYSNRGAHYVCTESENNA